MEAVMGLMGVASTVLLEVAVGGDDGSVLGTAVRAVLAFSEIQELAVSVGHG
jgi:hypothetical protein